jgi:flagellar hook-associated protein 1 FlgK
VTLMQGDIARHLSIDIDTGGSLKVLAENAKGSGSGNDITAFLSAGQLSGVLTVRDHDLVDMQADLDAFAFNVAGKINSVHASGFGLDGASGRQLFTLGATQAGAAASLQLNAAVQGRPDLVAASNSPAELPGNANQALLLAQVGDNPIAALGDLDPGQAYARLVGRVGQRKADSAATLDTRQAMTAQVETARQSISGVSLDEEMISLSKYQRAFEAASRVFTTADQLLQELLDTVGR